MKIPEPGINPAFDDKQTHTCTARVCFKGGRLHQLWMPADGSTLKEDGSPLFVPEWREVESIPADESAPNPEG